MFDNDQQIVQFLKQNLYVAAVCDVLDTLGYRKQAMHSRLRPLLPDMSSCGFAGRARTLQWEPTDHVNEDDPYGMELDAIDSLKPGDVVVHSTYPTDDCAPWGELMTTVARRNGVVGCVCDSNIRDCVKIIGMGFPVYCAGIRPVDSKGRGMVKAFDVPIECGDVMVHPGELIFADFDGVAVIPKNVERQVLQMAADKIGAENRARRDLGQGKTLRQTYQTHRVL